MQRQLNAMRQSLHSGNSRAPSLRQAQHTSHTGMRRYFPDQGSRADKALLGAVGDTWPGKTVVSKVSVSTAQKFTPMGVWCSFLPNIALYSTIPLVLQPWNKALCAGEKI